MCPVRTHSLRFTRVVLTTLTLLTIGCSESDPGDDYYTPLDASSVATADASNVGVADTGAATTSDAGTVTPGSGSNQALSDAGSSAPRDSGSVTPGDASSDAGTGFDAGARGDASLDGSAQGDASLDGSTQGDGALGDGAMGDAAMGDAAMGDAAMGDAAVDAQVPRMDLGKGNGSDVVMIGDSWMSNTLDLLLLGTGGGISPALQNVSRQPYRNYAVQGVMLLQYNPGFGPAIPTQWDDAVRANPNIKTVVMTGGGNDIIQGSAALQESCRQGTQLCNETLTKIGGTLLNLWLKMKDAGVQDIIYVLYAKAANTGRLKDPEKNNEALNMLCATVPSPTRCFTVNTDALVGNNGLAADGIHPTSAANRRVAQAIHDLMVKEGIRR